MTKQEEKEPIMQLPVMSGIIVHTSRGYVKVP